MTKKKRVMIGVVVLLFLLLIVILLLCIRKPIFSTHVDQIILKTYSHSHTLGNTEVVLDSDEAQKAILLYNFAGIGGEITSEPCCATYWLEVYFADGSQIRISEDDKDKMIITPVSGERYYIRSKALVNFVHELIERYDMVCD